MRHQDILKLQRHMLARSGDQLMVLTMEVARDAGISMPELLGTSHARKFAHPRQFFMWRARQEGHTYERIADFLQRHHTTVIEGVRQAQKRIDAAQQETA